MAMGGLRTAVVRMISFADILKRSHEAGTLGNTRWPLLLREILDVPSCDGFLCIVVPAFCNSLQLKTSTIQTWSGTDAPVPSGVVPRDADRYVLSMGNSSLVQAAGNPYMPLTTRLTAQHEPLDTVNREDRQACVQDEGLWRIADRAAASARPRLEVERGRDELVSGRIVRPVDRTMYYGKRTTGCHRHFDQPADRAETPVPWVTYTGRLTRSPP